MAERKTRPTDADVGGYLASVPNVGRRDDAVVLDAVMRELTGEEPVMWGTSIVGYGSIESLGTQATSTAWPVVAFSPRKAELVLYLNTELEPELFDALGPHRRGVGCLYVKRLADVDRSALRRLIARSIELARR